MFAKLVEIDTRNKDKIGTGRDYGNGFELVPLEV